MPAKNSPAFAPQMEREVTITRIFDAPRALVFEAWTDPRHMSQWFGPKDWTNPVCELDVKPGGAWRIVMRSPDGGEYPCGGVYREIVEPARLVFTNIALDAAGNHLLEGLTTVIFAEENGKTKLTLITRATGLVPQAPQMLQGMEAGWSQSLDKLAAKLSSPAPATSAREIVITRVFNAPRELVFAAWTDPQHIGRWYGPNGFTLTIHEMDVRPGGHWRFIMHGPDGVDYLNENQYLEIVKPERLVYLHGPVPKFQATVTFENENGKTRLTMRTTFATAAERDHVVKEYHAIEGGHQTLARLAEFLELQ
jgi:uncharacterized protein YndB with AHSA1/START domain